jgi:cysteine-rich repeat protein
MFKKALYLILIAVIVAQNNLFVLNTSAAGGAELSTSSADLVKGCPGTIDVQLNTNGASILAGDSTFSLTGDATIDSVSIGSALPMQTYNQVNGKQVKLSGARFPNTGGFNGSGTYGTIHLTPGAGATSVSVAFSPDMVIDNNVVNENIENVLSAVNGGTYTVNDKYDIGINGGYCTPDSSAPVFNLSDPAQGSGNNPADTNIVFTLTDDRSGVNISSLQYTVNGVNPANSSINESGGAYQVTVDPDEDFSLGSQVDVTVSQVCDNDGNCMHNQTKSFRVSPPASCGDGKTDAGEECDKGGGNGNMNECTSSCTVAKCGDGYILWGHEDCDDGNLDRGDGCTDECKLEPGATRTVITECPTPEEQQAEQPAECPTCPTCEVTAPVEFIQPEEVSQQEQNTATETARTVLQETQTQTQSGYTVNMEKNCDAFSFSQDSDKDGITDKMECYMGTDPNKSDTDSDSCNDDAEINQFMTDPLIVDCKEANQLSGVAITDPQAGWIVPTLKITGTTPAETVSVDVIAFPAEEKILKSLIDELTTVITTNSTKLVNLSAKIEEAKAFVAGYKDNYDYADLDSAITKLGNALSSVEEKLTAGQETDMRVFANNLTELQGLSRTSIYLGRSLPNAETDTMDLGTLRFKLEPVDVKLASEKLYDLIATSLLSNGEKVSSLPVRINVNREIIVKQPIPRYIGGVKIPGEMLSGGIFLDNVIASGEMAEVEVTDTRPTLSGDCEFGAQVFAVWDSIVLASSVIADSEEGSFNIQPPKDLAPNQSHKVTLYALKSLDGNKVRSENTEVYFHITKTGGGITATVTLISLFITAALIFIALKWLFMKKRKEEPVLNELIDKK